MSRWKELPGSLDQRVRQLVVQLRRLKDHSGLSLASLAVKTSYSKSSWERYLNGRNLPPREAVEALARVCGTDATRLMALHEVAAQAWGAERPAKELPERTAEWEPAADGRRRAVRARMLLPAAVVALIVAGAALLAVRPWQDDTGGGQGAQVTAAGRSTGAAPAFSRRPGETFDCHVRRTDGALYAGRSHTATAILGNGAGGWEVVEAQCLLHHRGYDPGPVDGIVGENTMRAVKRFQSKAGLPPDGIVGPDTWKVLRR
ncbi:peptidoglycan-binding protein [Streptomyces piniterrae]|uniref:Peptidoglycan-binding protein n=1 Tax=Streptomyces piniterrae TaxID=2571125 RepID=A0A4U0NFU7_9ACTN|nr:peptidoglycan-binding protein [Streptomyces piniterrae]TJZ53015.1 peptidoglycan-binding protein [Streptomyces piniterrae]